MYRASEWRHSLAIVYSGGIPSDGTRAVCVCMYVCMYVERNGWTDGQRGELGRTVTEWYDSEAISANQYNRFSMDDQS